MLRSSQKKKMRTKTGKETLFYDKMCTGLKNGTGVGKHILTCHGKGDHEEKWKE